MTPILNLNMTPIFKKQQKSIYALSFKVLNQPRMVSDAPVT
jgi:hypothetical protein